MKVRELIEALQKIDPELEVYCYSYMGQIHNVTEECIDTKYDLWWTEVPSMLINPYVGDYSVV